MGPPQPVRRMERSRRDRAPRQHQLVLGILHRGGGGRTDASWPRSIPVTSPASLVAANDAAPSDVLASFCVRPTRSSRCGSRSTPRAGPPAEAPPGHISASASPITRCGTRGCTSATCCFRWASSTRGGRRGDRVPALRRGARSGARSNRGVVEHGVLAVDVERPDSRRGRHRRLDTRARRHRRCRPRSHRAGGPPARGAQLRTPLGQPVPAATAWMLRGLSDTFDVATD